MSDISPILLQNQDDTYPTLPSTVPDSQVPVNAVQDHFQLLSPVVPLAANAVHKVLDKIMSQVEDNATQVLSPSLFKSLINRSRSAKLSNGQEETQRTLDEGDDGHVDLLSDFDQPHNQHDPDLDTESVHVDFSPSQSPQPLSQFPESQRFKTPLTVGKKRRYNGDVIDSPELPRNPLQNVGHVIGLSQAFAATQADTSPFTTNIALPSDRPSPNIELRPRPVTVTSSSMRMIQDFHRASTEPATRYVSSRQSQAEREERARIRSEKDVPSDADGSDDGFADSIPIAEGRKRERIKNPRAAFETVSSPTKKIPFTLATKFSPIRQTEQRPNTMLAASSQRVIHPSSPQSELENDSEAETDQEDNMDIAVTRSSQGYEALDGEDKENLSEVGSQVPETAARLQHALIGSSLRIQDSPLPRPRLNHRTPNRQFADSSQPSAVANSQPSQTKKRESEHAQNPKSSGRDGVEFVPQSPTMSQRQIRNGVEPEEDVDTCASPKMDSELPLIIQPSSERSQLRRRSTVPETSSNERDVQHTIRSGHSQSGVNTSSPEFDTARSRPRPSTNNSQRDIDLSSPPPSATPPGVKRVRLEDVEAIPSPQKSQSQGASSISDLFGGYHEQGEFGASQLSVRDFHAAVLPPPCISPLVNETRHAELDKSDDVSTQRQKTPEEQVEPVLETPLMVATSTYSRRTRKPSTKLLSALKDKPVSEKKVESSQWEIVASPPRKAVPVFRSIASTPKSRNPKSLRKVKSLKKRTPGPEVIDTSIKAAQITTQVHDEPAQETFPTPSPPSAAYESAHQVEASNKALETMARKGSSTEIDNVEPGSRSSAALDDTPTLSQGKQIESHPNSPRDRRPQTPQVETSTDPGRPTQGPPGAEATPTPSAPAAAPARVAPNMVFACFNGKTKAYYPARCVGMAGSDTKRFLIQWEGYDPQDIDEYGLCSLEVRTGDLVKINLEGFPKLPHVVRGLKKLHGEREASSRTRTSPSMTDVYGHDTVLVAPKQRKSLPVEISTDSVKEVPVSALYLDSNMWRQMKDRPYEYKLEDDLSTGLPLLGGTSTPAQRSSTPTTPTSRHRRSTFLPTAGTVPHPLHIHPPPTLHSATSTTSTTPHTSPGLFHNMAFAISHEEERKEQLELLIEQHGGKVLSTSFADLVDSTTMELQSQYANLEFAALLTDQHSRKVKYMQALALGLPCLSDKWIDACIEHVEHGSDNVSDVDDGSGDDSNTPPHPPSSIVDWHPYLLAAGKSDALDNAIKSRCLPFGSSTVEQMVSTRPNLLGGANVVFITGNGGSGKITKAAETAQQHHLFFVRAMGAGVVHLHSDLKAAAVKAGLVGGDRNGGQHPPVKYCFVQDRAAVGAARKMLQQQEQQQQQRWDKGKGNGKGKATSKSVGQLRGNRSIGPNVTILCNEDIIQSLIWGQLWIQ